MELYPMEPIFMVNNAYEEGAAAAAAEQAAAAAAEPEVPSRGIDRERQ